MITAGIDLAAEPRSTAAVVVDWSAGTVTHAEVGLTDSHLVALCGAADKIGIDCPLGWPDAFVDFVVAHRGFGRTPPADSIPARRQFAYRATDIWCQQQHGLRPLSVSADRIGHAALRCAGLLHDLGVNDRSGADQVVEAYPAGSLKIWKLYRSGYKKDPAPLAVDVLRTAGLEAAQPIASEHVLDALVAALTARAAALDHVEAIPAEHREAARVEGWIAVPTCSLEDLSPVPRTGSAADPRER